MKAASRWDVLALGLFDLVIDAANGGLGLGDGLR
jgi:hypothetical protein